MSLAVVFHFLCAQHVLDVNISIIRSLRLCCWITTSVVLFCKDGGFSVSVHLWCLVVCVWCDVLCHFVVVGRCIFIDIDLFFLSYQWKYTYQLQQNDEAHHTTKHHKCTLTLHPPSLQNKTTNVIIQQQSRRLLMMDILTSKTCWAHKKWNKTASDIKLVFYSSTITMMHGPINISFTNLYARLTPHFYKCSGTQGMVIQPLH